MSQGLIDKRASEDRSRLLDATVQNEIVLILFEHALYFFQSSRFFKLLLFVHPVIEACAVPCNLNGVELHTHSYRLLVSLES